MKITDFRDLTIWQLSLRLTKKVYDITSIGKFTTDYALREQIRRAVISISSNIVEGFEKNNNNEFIRFLRIAKGSVGEVKNQVIIAYTVNYISQADERKIIEMCDTLANQIGRFITYLVDRRKQYIVTRKTRLTR